MIDIKIKTEKDIFGKTRRYAEVYTVDYDREFSTLIEARKFAVRSGARVCWIRKQTYFYKENGRLLYPDPKEEMIGELRNSNGISIMSDGAFFLRYVHGTPIYMTDSYKVIGKDGKILRTATQKDILKLERRW